jgi:hypothetical protein
MSLAQVGLLGLNLHPQSCPDQSRAKFENAYSHRRRKRYYSISEYSTVALLTENLSKY